jgi:hypothetical protein
MVTNMQSRLPELTQRHLRRGEDGSPPWSVGYLAQGRCRSLARQMLALRCREPRWSIVQLVTTVSSARIPSVARRSALPVVITTALTVSRIYSSLRHETKRSFLLAAAGKTSHLPRFSPTSHKHSSRRSSKKRSSLVPSNVSTVLLLHAAASWDPSQKAFSLVKHILAPHRGVESGRVLSAARSTATGHMPAVPTQTPTKSSSSAAPLAGPAAPVVHK